MKIVAAITINKSGNLYCKIKRPSLRHIIFLFNQSSVFISNPQSNCKPAFAKWFGRKAKKHKIIVPLLIHLNVKQNDSILNPLLIFILLIFSYQAFAQLPPQPIGMWRDHLPYHLAIDVESDGTIVYAATPYSLFSVDPRDNTVTRYSRVSGL